MPYFRAGKIGGFENHGAREMRASRHKDLYRPNDLVLRGGGLRAQYLRVRFDSIIAELVDGYPAQDFPARICQHDTGIYGEIAGRHGDGSRLYFQLLRKG